MEVTHDKTHKQQTTDAKRQKRVLSGIFGQIVRPPARPTETRNLLATRYVDARGLDATSETALMTSATLLHRSTATNLPRRSDIERSFAGEGGIR